MANTLLSISMITKESLRVLVNNLVLASKVNRQYDNRFANKNAKIGNTVDARKPPRFTVRTGQALSTQDVTETSVTVTLDQQKGIDVVFSHQELLLDINEFSDRFLEPQVAALANQIDYDGFALYQDVYNAVGTPNTVPSTALTYLQAYQRLAEEAAPLDKLCVLITPEMQATIVNALTGLQEASAQIAKQYVKGRMFEALGFDWYMTQNIRSHTAGTYTTGSTPLVNGASQTGSSLVTDGWVASTLVLTKGDVITLAGVNAVNPQNRQDTGAARQFVVTDDVTSTAGGAATIPISPAISPSAADPNRTVTASPANDAAITPLGAETVVSPNGLAFHRDAFTLAMVDMPLPEGVTQKKRISDPQSGVSIRFIRDYDINQDREPSRLDVLYGWKTLYPELAVRIPS